MSFIENIHSKFTVTKFKNFLKLNLDNLDEEDNDYTSCWNGARYLFYLSGKKYTDSSLDYPNSIKKNDIYNFFSKVKNGIFHCFVETAFFHHFTIYIYDDNITLLSTYGGQNGLIHNKFNKEMFIRMLQEFNGDLETYKKIFGINQCSINDVINFKEIKYNLI